MAFKFKISKHWLLIGEGMWNTCQTQHYSQSLFAEPTVSGKYKYSFPSSSSAVHQHTGNTKFFEISENKKKESYNQVHCNIWIWMNTKACCVLHSAPDFLCQTLTRVISKLSCLRWFMSRDKYLLEVVVDNENFCSTTRFLFLLTHKALDWCGNFYPCCFIVVWGLAPIIYFLVY